MRLDGLDAARFLAFCGMVLVNFRIAAAVEPGNDRPSALTDLLEGRAAALFVVLAGIGISLAMAPTRLMLKRAAFLFVIGCLNLTIFDADILHFYALYFLVAIPFMTASNRALWVGALGMVLISLLGMLLLDYDKGWNWDTLEYSGFWTVEGFIRHSLFNGWHPVFPWAAFLLIGMWLGRLDLRSRSVQIRMILFGVAAAGIALIPQHLTEDPDLSALLGTDAIPPGPFYIMAGSGSAAAAIGLVLLMSPVLERTKVMPWLTAPGRQALTLYVAHILVGMGLLDELGLLNGTLTPAWIFWYSVGFCCLASVYARLWGTKFRRGPLEWLMRRLTG